VETGLQGDLPRIRCDSSQIQQVIMNLVMNAAEATGPKGGGMVGICTRQTPDGTDVVVEVKDNGEGIPAEHLSKIFDPFFTTKGEGKGVGLGLAVVYGVVNAHEGDIEVDSRLGQGTTFRVTLPVEGKSAAASDETVAETGLLV
jgi:two-component system NtrC family sensor kinase